VAELRFVLIRHGQTPWNADGRWQGHSDPSLSELGRAQAAQLAAALADHGIDAIVASDLRRALETATILGDAIGTPPARDPRLRELDVGRWGGSTRAAIALREPDALGRFDSGDPDARAGGGETRRELSTRVHAAVADLVKRPPGRCVALVVHSGVVRALLPGTEVGNAEWRTATAREIAANAECVGSGGRAEPL
jgi:broad specificity phosphatase PhoE